MKTHHLTFFVGFAALFLLYHAAEYMIIFHNSITGFLLFQAVFFIAAYTIARLQVDKGFAAYGLSWNAIVPKHLLIGALCGVMLYGAAWLLNIKLGIEKVTHVPSTLVIIKDSLPFVLGVFLSSLSEDIFTRGYIYCHLNGKQRKSVIVLVSASIYVLNHIYKIGKGPEAWLYLFFLGVLFCIPLVYTGRLWFTTALHWAGNALFYVSHQVITTDDSDAFISANYLFCFVIVSATATMLIYWKVVPVLQRSCLGKSFNQKSMHEHLS